jgi:DNA-binding transcriptional MocR family regulator
LKRFPPAQVTEAVASMMDSHEFSVHLRDVRAVYVLHLQRLRDALQTCLPNFALSEPRGGLHIVVHLPAHYNERDICAAAAHAGLPVAPLSHYNLGTRPLRGVIFRFGALSERTILPAVKQLSEFIAPTP